MEKLILLSAHYDSVEAGPGASDDPARNGEVSGGWR